MNSNVPIVPGSRLDDGPVGLGWTHNLDSSASLNSDGFQGMGEDSPIDAAAAIAEHYVSIDIMQGSKTKDRVVVATLAHRWFMDQLIDNIVTVREPGNTSKFVRLPDGDYNPPLGVASTLTKQADNSYLLRTKNGVLLDYDTAGKLITWKDPNNNTVTYTYNGGKLQSVGNGMGRTLTFTYNGDRISQVSDGTGRSVAYSYDSAGDLTAYTNCSGDNTTFSYDIDGRITKIYYPAHPTNPFVTNTYDSLDKVQTQMDGDGNTYHYYFSGFRAEEVNPLGYSHVWYFNSGSKTVRDIDALGNETSFDYDGHNRLILKAYPEGNSIAYEYDANHNMTKETLNPKPASTELPIEKLYTYELTFNRIKTYTDPRAYTTNYYYDSKGNLTRIDRPEIGGQIPRTDFSYNSRGQVKTTTDSGGMITGYTYDLATVDLLSKTVDQGPGRLNLTNQMSYDPVGNLIGKTDPRGHTTSFQYDDMRWLKQTTDPNPMNYVTKRTYDPNGNPIKVERDTGDVLNPWQTTTMTYTLTGKKDTMTDPEGDITSYQYDQADRLWKIIDAENNTTEYIYDSVGRLYQVVDALNNISEEHTYTPNGQKQSLKDAKGNTTQYEYDDFDRLHKTIYPDSSYEEFIYDTVGNITQKRTRSGEIITYNYDPLNRLDTKNPSRGTYYYLFL